MQKLKECLPSPYCRYYIRYLQPWNHERLVDPNAEKYWLPVDLYVGELPPPDHLYSGCSKPAVAPARCLRYSLHPGTESRLS